mmetsp:Transcript_84802/g.254276  ORF Transcript_84802/g.254276 Transcript_84802/m.254276 type:complete len:202 (+) Transcript_84802:761-1366(+)
MLARVPRLPVVQACEGAQQDYRRARARGAGRVERVHHHAHRHVHLRHPRRRVLPQFRQGRHLHQPGEPHGGADHAAHVQLWRRVFWHLLPRALHPVPGADGRVVGGGGRAAPALWRERGALWRRGRSHLLFVVRAGRIVCSDQPRRRRAARQDGRRTRTRRPSAQGPDVRPAGAHLRRADAAGRRDRHAQQAAEASGEGPD